jgi:hypothetical protein
VLQDSGLAGAQHGVEIKALAMALADALCEQNEGALDLSRHGDLSEFRVFSPIDLNAVAAALAPFV